MNTNTNFPLMAVALNNGARLQPIIAGPDIHRACPHCGADLLELHIGIFRPEASEEEDVEEIRVLLPADVAERMARADVPVNRCAACGAALDPDQLPPPASKRHAVYMMWWGGPEVRGVLGTGDCS